MKSHTKIFLFGYVTIKDLKYLKIIRVNSLYLIFSKYLTLVPTNESKEKYGELCNKIKDLKG